MTTALMSDANLAKISFNNTSNNHLRCSIKMGNEYVPFLSLQGLKSKSFQNFKLNSHVRCSIQINKTSFTVLTYFQTRFSGEYDLLLSQVKCYTCKNRKTRWATIAVYPNGEAYYNKLNHLK